MSSSRLGRPAAPSRAAWALPQKRQMALLILLFGVLISYLLKYHYSQATPEELSWILVPTTRLVEHLSGHDFQQELGIGWTSRSALIAITKACAGINFLIALGAALTVGLAHHWWTRPGETASFKGATARALLGLSLAWAGTFVLGIVGNSLRILVAIRIHGPHRLEGTLLFVALLFLGFATQRRLLRSTRSAPRRDQDLWLWLAPACCFGTTTVAVPLLNGAAFDQRFLVHAGTVAGCLAVALMSAALATWARPAPPTTSPKDELRPDRDPCGAP